MKCGDRLALHLGGHHVVAEIIIFAGPLPSLNLSSEKFSVRYTSLP